MSDGFANHTGINWNGAVGTVEYGGGDKGQVALFYVKPVHSPAKSQEAGSPIYEDRTYIKIHPVGERLNIVDRPIKDGDKHRFPMQWAQFQQHQEQRPDGTPIDLLYPDKPSVGAMLKAHSVYTIEQCAELSGPAIDNIGMGAQRYTNEAKAYLEKAHKGVHVVQFRKELEDRDRQIRVLTQQMEAMKEELRRMNAEATGGANLQQIQQLLAGVMQRPQYPAAGTLPGPGFDAATAQINATHATADISRQRRAAKAATPAKNAPRRQRARVED